MTPKELASLAILRKPRPWWTQPISRRSKPTTRWSPGHRKSITILREFIGAPADAERPKRMVFDFFAKPVAIEGDGGKAERIIVERTELDENGCGPRYGRDL
jgi:ferredoxin--NADP+ reductase